jgi:hypothetical protein
MGFRVLYEICCPGRRRKGRPTSGQLKQYLKYWRSRFDHPVADLLAETAITLIERRELTDQEVIDRMEIVARYPNLHSALNVLDYGCDDQDGRVEAKRDEIVRIWKASTQAAADRS